MFGSVGLLGYVWFGLVGSVWFGRFRLVGLVWYVWLAFGFCLVGWVW